MIIKKRVEVALTEKQMEFVRAWAKDDDVSENVELACILIEAIDRLNAYIDVEPIWRW